MKGRYGHVAVAAFGNTVLIAGGYRGSVLNDLVAYTVPLGIAKSLVSRCKYSLEIHVECI